VAPPKVNPDLQRAVDASAPGDQIDVVVDIVDSSGGLQADLDRLVAAVPSTRWSSQSRSWAAR
jgi:hypothetical protein